MKITWRAVKEEDIDQIVVWLNVPETQKLARSVENKIYVKESVTDDFLSIIEGRRVQIVEVDGNMVGWFKIWDHGEDGRELGIVIADPEYRRKGVGTFIVNRLIQILEPPLYWVTSTYNEGSIALALKCEFALLTHDSDAITLEGKTYDKYIFVGGKHA